MKREASLAYLSVLFFMLLAGFGCTATPEPAAPVLSQSAATNEASSQQAAPLPTETTPFEEPGSWIPETRGPWNGSIYQTSSQDGLAFSGKTLVLDSAGVPNLLQIPGGDLILIYQYFSAESRDLFDVIAYSVSSDGGDTWSSPAAVTFSGLPAPSAPSLKPMDPTLVRTDTGELRLYFTYHAKGSKVPVLFLARAEDGNIASPFVVEETPSLAVPGTFLLDPAVTYFNGLWHHYTWQDQSNENFHSTSEDGLSFVLQPSISIQMDFLGHVVPEGTGLRFYGTGTGQVQSAYSTDGDTWTMDPGARVQGADPGVAKLPNGTYLMAYTSMNFNK